MGKSLDELRKKIYGSAAPDQKTVQEVRNKALEVTTPVQKYGDIGSSYKSGTSGSAQSSFTTPAAGNLEALKSQQEQAKKERDEAHQAFLNLYALESNPDTAASAATRYEKYSTAEDARKARKAADSAYQDALNAYYEAENKSKLTDLSADKKLTATYESAKELEADLKKVQEATITAGATGNADASDLAYLKKKYGVSGDSVFSLQESLQKKLDTLSQELKTGGYSYERLSGFQEREAKKTEYETQKAEWEEFAGDHPVASSALSVLASPFQGIDFVRMIGSSGGNGDSEDAENYVPPNVYDADIVNFVNTVRGTVSKEIEENTDWELFGQNVASFLYQTGMSITDSATQVAALGPASIYFMGASSAANQAANVIERGGTTRQAFAGGLAAGVAEGLFEKVSIDRLLDPSKFNTKTVKDALKNIGAQSLVEGSEEIGTEIANILTDAAVMGSDSSFSLSVQAYENAGMSEEEAKKQAFLDSVGQVIWAGVGGALSGVSLGGARITFSKAQETANAYKTGAQLKTRMSNGVDTSVFAEIQKGMDAPEGSEARLLAESAQKQLDSKKRVSNATLGRLVWANQGNVVKDVQAVQSTGETTPETQELLTKVAQEPQTSGTLTSATASELHTAAAQDVVGAVSVQEKEAAAKAANPKADVQSMAVTAFTDMGMKLKTAQEKAEIVTRLMDGEEVSNRDINKLNPTSPAMRQVFSQLTGVEFPAGKITQETLYNLYRSAKDVKTTEQVVAEVEAADAELQGAREILDNQLPDGVTMDTILQSAVSGMSGSQSANDAEAARILGEQLGEIDVNGAPLVSFSAFSEMYRSRVNEKATREELARAYDQYRREVQTGQFQGKRQTRAEFAQTIRSAPGGAQLTDAEIDALFQQVQDANRSGEDGYDRYALNESERLQKKLLNRVPEAQREKTAAEMSRRGELDRAAKYMSAVLKDLGIAPGVVVEYGDENTRRADAFVASDGTIHFNGDKISGASMMQYILGHELTHTASRIAGGTSVTDTVIEVFRKLYDAGVLSGQTERWMADVDGRLDTLQRRYRQHAKAVGDNADVIDRAYVREELAADLMRQVFVSEDLMSRLAGERPSLLMRARRTADRILAKLTGNENLRTVVSARDELKRLGDLFEKTLRKSEAEATYRSGQVIETEDGSPVAVSEENGDMKFSLGSFDEHGRNVLRSWMTRAVRRGDLTQEDADSIMESMETIYRVCREHQAEYAPFDNWSEAKVVTDDKGRPVFSVVKANGDYAMNLDFSTVCKKRRTLDAVLNELVRNGWASENRIAEDQMVKINDIIRAHGFETACALCFVDSKRFRQDKIAGDFTEMYNRAVKSLVPDGSDIPVNTFDFAGRGLTDQENGLDMRPASDLDFSGLRDTMAEFGNQTVSYKIAKYLMDHPADRRLLDKSDFLSSAGFNVISREKPGILSLFNSKKGSGGPKSTFGDVQYLNEIIRSRTFNAKKAFSVGGVRIQSFSDYVPRMVFDYVQMIGDLSAKKLPAHSYTKEELFVKQFGLTGIKINMSLIPRVVEDGIAPGLDSRGDYIWADESFDFNTAVEIQGAEGYSRNCGTIAVGISDEHIRAMMSDDRIRMIIPYHKSGLNPVVAELNNIDSFVDYTGSQNTRYSDGRKIEDKKILKTIPDFNQEMRRLGDPRAAAEAYVRFCESKGYLPKFDQFAYQQVGGVFVEENGQRVIDPNYYKLLEDFTVYDNGEYVGQEAVRPVYPTEDAAFGGMTDLLLRGLDEDAVLEGRRDAEVASIVREVEDTLGDVRTPGLRGGDGRDTMNTSRYSLGEDLAYGAEQRESAEEFRRRSLREGYAVLSFGGAEFAFRRGRGSVLSGMELGDAEKAGRDTPAGETERELTALGIPCDVISGPVFWNNGSVTRGRVIQEATTAAGRHVFIDENTSLPPREIAGHEAFHFWSKSGAAEDYKDTVLENLNFTSPAFQKFQSDIAEAYLGTQADLADERQYAKLLEELLAYISGKIHAGGQDDARRSMLRDYDSVVRAWEDLVGGRTSGQARYALPDRDLSFAEQVDLTLLNKFNEVMAPGRSGQYGSAESALYVAREPNSLLQDIGFGDLPIVITQQHVRQITGRREDADGRVVNEHNHQLTQDQVSRIPELLQNPAAILRAKGRPGSAVIVTEENDYKGRPVIIPIKSNGMDLVYDGMVGPAHVITSMYGRDNFGKFFADAVNSGDLLYADKKRIDPILTTAGYQSSGLLSGIDSQTILGQITPNVNTRERRYALSEDTEKSVDPDTRYSITPEFEQWYKENYGVDGDVTDAQLRRAMKRQDQKVQRAEESAQAARSKAKVDAENTLTAWLIYYKKNMRRLNRDLQKKSADRVAELRKEKAQALQDKDLAWRIYHEAAIREQQAAGRKAEKDLRKELTQDKRDAVRTATEVERAKAAVQHDADVMAFKRQAAARLRVKDTRYAEQKERTKDQVRLKRKAAERALKDSRQAAKKRAEMEAKNGTVKTIREIPAQRKRIEKLQEQAANLKTLFRPAYAAFVNQAKSIDDFAKRQSGGVLSSTLVNVLGGSSTTIESVFKRGLVDRSGNRIGDAMKNVFLVWDGKKVDEAKQALLQDYMLHAHNVDRMSFVKNARAKLEAFETENPWLRDMDQREFARLVAMTETEIQETGKKKAHDLAVEYAKLLDRYNRSQDKPIFADANGNAVTAETSQAIVEQYLAENPWLEEKAQGIYDWWDQFMRTWAVGDSLTLEQYEIMREIYPHYVPTYRADKKGVGAANFVGAGGATIGTAVKKAKGGFSEVVNIEDSFANLANKIIRLARTNELYKNIIDTALLEDGADSNVADMAVFDWDSVTMGDSYKTESGEIVSAFSNGFDMSDRVDEAERPGLLKVKDGYKLSAWYDGQLLSAYISEDLYKSIARVTGSDANDFSRAFLKAGNALTGPMKTAITGANPMFALRNISRDYPTAIINSISGWKITGYMARAGAEMNRNSDNWQVFQALGGTHAGYYNNEKGFAGAMAQRDNVFGRAVDKISIVNNVTESVVRFAEYLATIDRLGDTYENRLLGIKNAAEVTVDFSRKGWLGKYINAWVPYWNPAVQGIDKVIRSAFDAPGVKPKIQQAFKTGGRAAVTFILFEAISQALLTMLGDRDEWEKLDDRTKDAYYCIPTKFFNGKENTFIKIPKNRDWAMLFGTPFMRILEWANGRDDPFENYIETSIAPNFVPPHILFPDRENGGLQTDVLGMSWVHDLAANEDFAGRTIIPYAYEQGSLTEQYDADTSTLAYALGKLLKFSPMQLDYIISDYFGDWADLLKRATPVSGAKNLLSAVFSDATVDKLIPLYTDEARVDENGFVRDASDILFGGFVADSRYSNAYVSKYYDTMDKLDRVVQDKKNQMGDEAAKETIEYQTQSAINKLYGKTVTDINKTVRGLPDGEEKDAAKAEIARLAEEALDFYEQSLAGNVESPKLQAEYNEYAPSVRNVLIDLNDYSTEYRFKPTGEASDSYTDPTDDTREYVLSEDQKDKFHEIYVEQYNDMAGDLINQSTYRGSKPEEKAEMLEGLRDDVLDATKEEFFLWLERTKARSTPKS